MATRYVASSQALAAEEAHRDFLSQETIRLKHELKSQQEFRTAVAGLSTTDSVAEVTGLLATRTGELGSSLEEITQQARSTAARLEAGWQQARQANIERRLGEARESLVNRDEAMPVWRRTDDLLLVASAVAAMAGWGFFVVYQWRRWCRSHLFGRLVTAVAVSLIVATLGGATVGAGLGLWTVGGKVAPTLQQTLSAEIDRANHKVADARVQTAAALRDLDAAASRWRAAAKGLPEADQKLLDAWLQSRQKLCDYSVAAASIDSAQAGWTIEKTSAAAIQPIKIDLPRRRAVAELALGTGGFLWLAVAVAVWQQRRKTAWVCPKCNAAGQLKQITISDGRHSPKLRDVQCEAKWDGRNVCNFRMRDEHRLATRLCFPAVGIPASGKTHWLAVTYDRLLAEKYQNDLDFHHIETRGSTELDRVLSLLHGGQRELEANQVSLPDPVVFRFADRNRWGRSQVLVNLFDYSGEVFRMLDLDRPLRRRMMQADGILMFIDPLRGVETQLREMKRFLDDADRSWLRVPGAVCLSKIDMLLAGEVSGELAEFQWRLQETAGRSDLAAIDARSRATAPLIRSLWPHVDIDRIVQKTFRGNFRYFPLSSVGFAPTEAASEPQFVLEPLLWLLEQNGFRVFSSPRAEEGAAG